MDIQVLRDILELSTYPQVLKVERGIASTTLLEGVTLSIPDLLARGTRVASGMDIREILRGQRVLDPLITT